MRYKLGEICKVVSGSTPKTGISEYWDGDIKWITPAELSDDSYIVNDSVRHITELGVQKTGLTSFPAGTVILSSRAPIGKVAIAGCEMYCNQGFKNLICSDKINNRYLYWFLKGNTEYLNSLGRGATFKEISKQIVSGIEINVPDMPMQIEAVEVLEKISGLIGIRREQLQRLDDLIKARFVEMFGDPSINPEKLPTMPMTDVCEIIDGDRGKNYPTADEFSDDGYCLFLNAKNVTASGFNFDTCMFVSKEKDEELRKGKLSRGDVVLTTRGTLGNLAFYTNDIPFENVRINSGMVILRMKQNMINEVYFIEQFKMQLADIKEKIASGSAQPQLSISTMNKIQVLVPDLGIQDREGHAVMLISGMHAVSEDPPVLIAGGLHSIGKDLLVFSFVKPAAVRIRSTFFDLFSSSGGTVLWIVILLFLQRFLSVCFPI